MTYQSVLDRDAQSIFSDAPFWSLFADTLASERFEEYCSLFQDVFRRADQFERFRYYMAGLLAVGDRKNIESIAAQARRQAPHLQDLSQALQHFVSQSPWDGSLLLKRYRALIEGMEDRDGNTLAIHDCVFPKKGRHSVGVQRQYARSHGRKINCQVAVVVSLIGPAGFHPLAIRLYLPSSWLRDNTDRLASAVPGAYQTGKSKAEIAIDLLGELRDEGIPIGQLVAEEGYAKSPAFQQGLAEMPLNLSDLTTGSEELLGQAVDSFAELKNDLGLDHFEGRNWLGWNHHASLVFAAHGYRTRSRTDSTGQMSCPKPLSGLRPSF